MPIVPLPQFEADVKQMLDEQDRETYEALKAPKTLVVRFGSMKMIGEFATDGQMKPGCGSKVVVKTWRGTEVGEMLTSTCPNSGCGKSVSRKQMLEYIENSGGKEYPFSRDGRVLRIATPEDLEAQARIEQSKHALNVAGRTVAQRIGFKAKIVECEPILGGECITVYYLSEERPELRDIVRELGHAFGVRVEPRMVGARDEARLVADYEKCGQYCCCKNFLKVLKPISMKSAKVQKATLDPLKISGRCGRLMCCLRYEDSTYEDLKKNLPRKKSRVGTPEGDGIVMDTQILTQLALVLLDEPGPDGKMREVAIPVENLEPPKNAVAPVRPPMPERGGFGRPMGPRPGGSGPMNAGSGSGGGMPASGGPAAGAQAGAPGSGGPISAGASSGMGSRPDRGPDRGSDRGSDRGPRPMRPEGREDRPMGSGPRPDGRRDGGRDSGRGDGRGRPNDGPRDRGPERGPDVRAERGSDRGPGRGPGGGPGGPRPDGRTDGRPEGREARPDGRRDDRGPTPPRLRPKPRPVDDAVPDITEIGGDDLGGGPDRGADRGPEGGGGEPRGIGGMGRRRRRGRGRGPGGPSGGPSSGGGASGGPAGGGTDGPG